MTIISYPPAILSHKEHESTERKKKKQTKFFVPDSKMMANAFLILESPSKVNLRFHFFLLEGISSSKGVLLLFGNLIISTAPIPHHPYENVPLSSITHSPPSFQKKNKRDFYREVPIQRTVSFDRGSGTPGHPEKKKNRRTPHFSGEIVTKRSHL